jgi:exopolyphosphatase/guanosine-5'-triphosphate,3'-diphosphate pyrophosphatase
MGYTLLVLKEFFEAARQHGATEIRAGATMAARIATNSEAFLSRARAQQTPVEIISGQLEANLGFQAVAGDPLFAHHPRLSIVDPGGHSTELVTANQTSSGWEIAFSRSFPVGTLGLKSGIGEAMSAMEVLRTVSAIDDTLGLAYRPGESGVVVALGAAATNLISIREKLTHWDANRVHGTYLDYEEISKAAGWLMPMTDVERAQILGMEPGREATVHLGALILERFLHALRVLGCYVSVRGWRWAWLDAPDWGSNTKD